MGGSAIALAEGLRDRPGGAGTAKVLTHDLFRWKAGSEAYSWAKPFGVYQDGEDFAPEARRYIRDRAGDLVEVRKVDLLAYGWTEGPIALLHIDAMKTLDIARRVTHSFYPSLLPGSILIHQDYKHSYTSWIHVLQFRLRPHFELLRSVDGTSMVAFRCVSPVSAAVARDVLADDPSDEEVERCFEWSKGLVGGEIINIQAAHLMEYIHLGRIEKARRLLERYREAGLTEQGDMRWLIRNHLPAELRRG